MTITFDKVTAEMLAAVMAKKKQSNSKKFLTEVIQRMYLSL